MTKCRFYEACGTPENVTCTKDGGLYYETPNPYSPAGRMAGCYRLREEEELRAEHPNHIHVSVYTQKEQVVKSD